MSTDLKFQRPAVTVPLTARSSDSLERLRPELDALDPKTLAPINVDVALAVSRALGVVPAIASNRERMLRECPGVDIHAIDQLEDRAYALQYASARYESAVAPPSEFNSVVEEVMEARTVLLSVAKGLVACNLLGADEIGNMNGGHGYREAAADALLLVSALRANFAVIEGKMPFSREQLSRVEGAANRLAALVGVREQTPERAAAAADVQRRAFRLVEVAYNEVRRAITFLRWDEDDADIIAPSLRAHAFVRKPIEKKSEDAAPVDPAKPAQVITTATTDAPVPPAMRRPNPYGTA